MKLKEFINNLNALVENRPEIADFDVVTSKDDEGNGYNLVHYTPTVGTFDPEFKDFEAEQTPNAICIN